MHQLIAPFDIDDGSLDDVSPREAFALGVEWELFRQKLKNGQPFHDLCMKENALRLEKLAERDKRYSECRETSTPDWMEVWVGPRITEY